MANTNLIFFAVTENTFHYYGHTHALYRWQGPLNRTEKLQEIFNQSYKVQIMPQVIYGFRGGRTQYIHIHICMKVVS